MTESWEHPEVKAYFEHARQELFPKVNGSAMSVTILASEPDPKLCMELGAAILFDKPIIVLVPQEERSVPANLKRVATVIVYGDPRSPGTQARLQAALTAVIENDARTKVSPECEK